MKFSINKGIKKYIDALWIYKKEIYVLIDDRISKKDFLKKFKKEANIYSLRELLREVTSLNTGLLLSIRGGKIINDSAKLINILASSLKKGILAGTSEHLLSKLDDVQSKLKNIDSIKIKILQNIYNSVVESAQSFLVWHGSSFVVPSEIPKGLRKFDVNKVNINDCKNIIKYYKDFEHERIKEIKGKDLDLMIHKLNIFKEVLMK